MSWNDPLLVPCVHTDVDCVLVGFWKLVIAYPIVMLASGSKVITDDRALSGSGNKPKKDLGGSVTVHTYTLSIYIDPCILESRPQFFDEPVERHFN